MSLCNKNSEFVYVRFLFAFGLAQGYIESMSLIGLLLVCGPASCMLGTFPCPSFDFLAARRLHGMGPERNEMEYQEIGRQCSSEAVR